MAGPEPSEFYLLRFCLFVRFHFVKDGRAGAIRILPSACSFVFSLSKMARARTIRILLLPVRSFQLSKMARGRRHPNSPCPFRLLSVCLRWPGHPNSPSAFSFAFSLSKMAPARAIRILPSAFSSFSFVFRLSKMVRSHPNSPSALSFVFRSGPKPSEFSFCLFVRFQFVEDGPGRSHPSPSALSFLFDFSFCLFVRLQFVEDGPVS